MLESPITNNTTATSKVSTNHVDTDYLARRHDPGFFLVVRDCWEGIGGNQYMYLVYTVLMGTIH